MANVAKDLVFDVEQRIGKKENPGTVLRVMNQIYKALNRELQCVTREITIPSGTFSDTVKSFAVADHVIRPFNIIPEDTSLYTVIFVPKEQWNPNQLSGYDCFTMLNGYFVFSNVGSDTQDLTIYVKSTGKTLVAAEDALIESPAPAGGYLSTDYANTPEWPTDFHRLLVYETAFELSAAYPNRANDERRADEMRTNLAKHGRNDQGVTPEIIGGLAGGQLRASDPDYVNGMWVTRL